MTPKAWLASFGLATGLTLGFAAGLNTDDLLAFIMLIAAAVIVVALSLIVLGDQP